jgi:hypothetical protein
MVRRLTGTEDDASKISFTFKPNGWTGATPLSISILQSKWISDIDED